MSTMDDLITWLRAQLDDDEQTARDFEVVAVPHGDDPPGDDYLARYAVRFDPARVLREVEAKRRIIKLAERVYSTLTYDTVGSPASYAVAAAADTLRLLALPFSDRPGYLDTWRP